MENQTEQTPHLVVVNEPTDTVTDVMAPFFLPRENGPYLFRDERLAAWVEGQLGLAPGSYQGETTLGLGIRDKSHFMGAALFHNFHRYPNGVLISEASIATVRKDWASRHVLRGLFSLPFVALGATMLRTFAPRPSKQLRTFNRKLGFKERGIADLYFKGEVDGRCFTMKRDDCKWIR